MVGFEGVKKGSWSREEDALLKKCVETHGEGRWHEVPLRAGLNRCRKSCRLRWLNYLKPNINKGAFAADEVDLMLRLHNLLGNRWSLIAGRLPGRTANDVKNYWKTHMNKKFGSNLAKVKHKISKTLIKPKAMKPRSAQTCQTGEPRCSPENAGFTENVQAKESNMNNSTLQAFGNDAMWWDSVLTHQYGIRGGTCCAGGSEQVPKTNLLLEGISPAAADAGKSAAEEGRNGWSDVSFETDLRDIFKTIL